MRASVLLAVLVVSLVPGTNACRNMAFGGCSSWSGDCGPNAFCDQSQCSCVSKGPCDLKACVEACGPDKAVPRIYDQCVQGCNEKCPPKPSPPSPCPGGSLKACMLSCPPTNYKTCVEVCSEKCPKAEIHTTNTSVSDIAV